MTCYALLAAMPILMASNLVWGSKPAGATASARASEPSEGGEGTRGVEKVKAPSISITIEPAAIAPVVEAESPVVFPGYLLPDDESEEPAHAGS